LIHRDWWSQRRQPSGAGRVRTLADHPRREPPLPVCYPSIRSTKEARPKKRAGLPLEGGMAHCREGALQVGKMLAYSCCWEVLYQIFKNSLKPSPHPKVRELGASYSVAFINALVCSVGGFSCVVSLWKGGYTGRTIVTLGETSPLFWAGLDAGEEVYERFAHAFLGWLFYDVVHVVSLYPKLGGVDTVSHHVGFICLTCLGSVYHVIPFSVAWLLLGEVSSLPLNVRWFLIHTGRGADKALTLTNLAFALSFFLVRVAVFWAGVYHLIMYLRPSLIATDPYGCPMWVLDTVTFFITAGACLNAQWMIGIVKMATRGPPGQKEHISQKKI